MKIVVAPDSFKGNLTALEVAEKYDVPVICLSGSLWKDIRKYMNMELTPPLAI